MAFTDTTPRAVLQAWGRDKLTLSEDDICVGDPLGIDASNDWVKAEASTAVLAMYVAIEDGDDGDVINVARMAVLEADFSAVEGEEGDALYLSDTGTYDTSVGSTTQVVGWIADRAVSDDDRILINPRNPLQIDASDIANDSIDSEHYVAASIDNEHLANDAADSDEIASGAIDADHLSTTLKTGFIPLDITALREIDTNAIQNLAAHGGILASDSDPALERVNADTDKALRVTWTAEADEVEVQFPPVPMPPDIDAGEDVSVHLVAAMEAQADTPTIDVQAFDAVGDTEMGEATGALSDSVAEVSATIANAGVSGHPAGFLNIALVPAAHETDDLYLYAAWIEYVRA